MSERWGKPLRIRRKSTCYPMNVRLISKLQSNLHSLARFAATCSVFPYLSPEVTGALVGNVAEPGGNAPPPVTILGKREREVLQLLAEGMRSAEIAATLGISPATVDVHRRNLKQKLNLHTTAELTRYAIREGLSKP